MVFDVLDPEDGALNVLGLLAVGVAVLLDDGELVLESGAVLGSLLVVLQHVVQPQSGPEPLRQRLAGLGEHLLRVSRLFIIIVSIRSGLE